MVNCDNIESSTINDERELIDDDEKIDSMVENTLRLIRPLTEELESKAFENLTAKLLNGFDSLPLLRKTKGSNVAGSSSSQLARRQEQSEIYNSAIICAPPLKAPKVPPPPTVGKGWFNIEPVRMDESIKRDMRLIEMRNYLDPKRFYKKVDKIGTILHVGTVVEGPHEYKSQRLTRAERKRSIADELLADKGVTRYSKKIFVDLQNQGRNVQKFGRMKKVKVLKKSRAYF